MEGKRLVGKKRHVSWNAELGILPEKVVTSVRVRKNHHVIVRYEYWMRLQVFSFVQFAMKISLRNCAYDTLQSFPFPSLPNTLDDDDDDDDDDSDDHHRTGDLICSKLIKIVNLTDTAGASPTQSEGILGFKNGAEMRNDFQRQCDRSYDFLQQKIHPNRPLVHKMKMYKPSLCQLKLMEVFDMMLTDNQKKIYAHLPGPWLN